ncbi:MAG: hypothetical protein V8Q36_03620 [Anaerotignum sp.]
MLKIETENKKLIWKLPEKESDQLFTHLSLQLIELTGGVAKCAAERTEDVPDLVPTGKKTKRHQGIKGSKNQLKQAKNILDRFISSATTADQKKAGYPKNLRKNIIVQTVERSLC